MICANRATFFGFLFDSVKGFQVDLNELVEHRFFQKVCGS